MEKKRALLIVAGGRAEPDVLSFLWLQPHMVIIFTSEEGWKGESGFMDIAKMLPGCEIAKIIRNISAYNLSSCYDTCLEICQTYPLEQWEWVFCIGSAPKVSGIAAYEAAKVLQIPCWYVDTSHEKLVSLVKDTEIDAQKFFHLDIKQYMKIQHKKYKLKGESHYRRTAERWGFISKELARSDDTSALLPLWRDKKAGEVISLPFDLINSPLLRYLREQGLLNLEEESGRCSFTSDHAASFLGTGDWLEIYVWYEITQLGFADSCLWGCEIYEGEDKNELDVVFTYRAQLVVVECKTDQNPFRTKDEQGRKRDYLKNLDAVANLLGGTYVTKLFVTSQYGEGEAFTVFSERAKKRGIVPITKEGLPQIGRTIEKEAKTPTYART